MRKLDYSKVRFASEPVSSADALKDVIPYEWPDSVLNGDAKAELSYVPKREEEVHHAMCKRGDIIGETNI